jgi:hypothetical protein
MKQFLLITIGFTQPTPEIMEEWMQWFQSIEDKMIDQVGLMDGIEVTKDGTKPLPMDQDAITGYLVINAESMDEAVEIAKRCPMITSTKVYEIMGE